MADVEAVIRAQAIELAKRETYARERLRNAYLAGDPEEEEFARMELEQVKKDIDDWLPKH